MGLVLQNVCEIGILATGIYGVGRGWNARLANEINRISDGRLEELVEAAPRLTQPILWKTADILPYTIAVYGTMQIDGRIAGLL